MAIKIPNYDLTFAVKIRQVMLFTRWLGNEDRREKVWIPTQNFLQDFADSLPEQVVCFYGGKYNFPRKPNCFCYDIFIVNHCNEVGYLCTVFNRSAMRQRRKESTEKMPRGKVIRSPVHYIVPSSKEEIDQATILVAIRRYLRSYKGTSIPSLAQANIELLLAETGAMLDDRIHVQADPAKKDFC